MPFVLVFGIILTLIALGIKHFTLKEVDTTLCASLQLQQAKDIVNNKKISKVMLCIGAGMIIVALIFLL